MELTNFKIKGDWQEVVDDCRNTVSKPPLGKDPSDAFKENIVISEHSPIRDIIFRWKWVDIKSWVATHFARHRWEKFISTQRTDRTGINRDELPQGALVDMQCEANVQHLIDTSRKRLCFMASKETREAWEMVKREVQEVEPQIGIALVPNCIYRCGCPEMGACKRYAKFRDWCYEMQGKNLSEVSISERYKLFDQYYHSVEKR